MENNQSKETTFTDVIKQVFKHKIVIVALTLVVAIIGTIFLGVLPNNKDKYYSATFEITLPTGNVFNLSKGQEVDYYKIVSLENMKEVKASSNEYKDLNVEEIANKRAISIVKEEELLDDKTTLVDTYKLTVNPNYFDNIELARKFVKDLVKNSFDVSDVISAEKLNYESNYDSAITYEAKLSLNQRKLDAIVNAYESAVNALGNVVINGKTIGAHKQAIIDYQARGIHSKLETELLNKCFAPKDDELLARYKGSKESFEIEKANNDKAILVLRNEIANIPAGASQYAQSLYNNLTKFLLRNEEIDVEISRLNKKIDYAGGEYAKIALERGITEQDVEDELTAYKNQLEAYHQQVMEFNDSYFDNVGSFYKEQIRIDYNSSSILTEEGGKNVLLIAVVSTVLGLIAGLAVSYLIELLKTTKTSDKKEEQEQAKVIE